jgi:hypothetical protein
LLHSLTHSAAETRNCKPSDIEIAFACLLLSSSDLNSYTKNRAPDNQSAATATQKNVQWVQEFLLYKKIFLSLLSEKVVCIQDMKNVGLPHHHSSNAIEENPSLQLGKECCSGTNQVIPTHCSRHGTTVSDFELPDKEM